MLFEDEISLQSYKTQRLPPKGVILSLFLNSLKCLHCSLEFCTCNGHRVFLILKIPLPMAYTQSCVSSVLKLTVIVRVMTFLKHTQRGWLTNHNRLDQRFCNIVKYVNNNVFKH